MNETDICRAGINNRDADRRVVANSVGDGMKARSFESAVDELCRMMLVPVMTFAIFSGFDLSRNRLTKSRSKVRLFSCIVETSHARTSPPRTDRGGRSHNGRRPHPSSFSRHARNAGPMLDLQNSGPYRWAVSA